MIRLLPCFPVLLALVLLPGGNLYPGDLPNPRFETIDQLQDNGKLREAEALLLQIEAAGTDSPEFYYQKGRLFLNRGDPENALLWIGKADSLDPENPRFLATMGSAYGLKAADAPLLEKPILANKMTRLYRRAIELDPTHKEPWFGLIEYRLQAPPLFGGNRRKADKLAAEYRAINPYFGELAHARIDFHDEDFEAALAHLDRAVGMNPDRRMGQFMRAVLANNRGAYDVAWESLQSLLLHHPEDSAVIYQVGKYAALSGRRLNRGQRALESYLTFEERPNEPSHASAWWRLGMIFEHRNQIEQARTAYQMAIRLDPRLEEPAALLQNLDP